MDDLNLADFHCHLDLHQDMEAAFRRCDEIGCTTFTVTTTPRTYPRNIEFANRTDHVKAALGLHPQLVAKLGKEIALFEELAKTTQCIGEIGLDASRAHYASFEQQREVFEKALLICASQGEKVISIHSVRCARQVLDYIEATAVFQSNVVVLHWFSASKTELKRAIDLGCWFSVNEQMLKSVSGQNVVAMSPRDRLLTETDAPFIRVGDRLARGGEVRGALKKIAEIWGQDIGAVAAKIVANAKNALGCVRNQACVISQRTVSAMRRTATL